MKDFRVYEIIPKECVDGLNKYLIKEEIEGDVYIKSDPLIMRHFDEITNKNL